MTTPIRTLASSDSSSAEPSTTYPGWPCDEAKAPGVRSQHRVVLRVVCANLLARFVHLHPAIIIHRPQIGFHI